MFCGLNSQRADQAHCESPMAIKGSKNSKKCTGNSIGSGTPPQFYNPTEIRGYNLGASSKSIIHQKSAARTVIFDTLRADDEKTNTKSQTLFFGIPKGLASCRTACRADLYLLYFALCFLGQRFKRGLVRPVNHIPHYIVRYAAIKVKRTPMHLVGVVARNYVAELLS